jgi:hypothetical protein
MFRKARTDTIAGRLSFAGKRKIKYDKHPHRSSPKSFPKESLSSHHAVIRVLHKVGDIIPLENTDVKLHRRPNHVAMLRRKCQRMRR